MIRLGKIWLRSALPTKQTAEFMELSFQTRELRDLCGEEAKAIKHLGAIGGQNLRKRVADIRAAESMADLLQGNPRVVEYSGIECIQVELGDFGVIYLASNQTTSTLANADQTDWLQVYRMKLIAIETSK